LICWAENWHIGYSCT